MPSPILFAGGEDIDFSILGPGIVSTVNTNGVVINTTANRFRAGFARYGLDIHGNSGFPNNCFLHAPFAATQSFWFTARIAISETNNNSFVNNRQWVLSDSNSIGRLRLRTGPAPGSTWFTLGSNFVVEKVNSIGTVTTLGSGLAGGFSNTPSTPDKLDVFVNYAVAGQLTIYINGVQVFNFVGDVTTDSVTSLAFLDLGTFTIGSSQQNSNVWSEVIVATRDTRNMSLVTQSGLANGNSDTFTGGGVALINGNQPNDINPNYSTTAAQLQQYTVTPTLPTGNFSIISLVQHGRVTFGSTGPAHIDFNVRTGGADFFAPDQNLGGAIAYGLITYNWDQNPNTLAAWLPSDINAAGFNMGFRSAA